MSDEPADPRAPADARPTGWSGVALVVLAVLASLVALQWARPVLIPVLMGILLSYAVTPFAARLEALRIPRMAGGAIALSALLGLAGWGAWALADQADELLESLPPATVRIRELLQGRSSTDSTLRKVERAVAEIEAAAGAPGGQSAERSASPAQSGAHPPATRFDVRAYVLSGSIGVLVFAGQVLAMFFIALFLVAAGTTFRRKLVRIAGPTLSRKKITVETLNEINDQIQRYLLLQLAISAGVGVATWLVFLALGLNQAAVWGVIAGVTNLVPYVGAVLVGVGAALVAFAQFGTLEMALLVSASSFAIRTLNGNLLAPWLMGKAGRMNPVVVFVTVLVFGWLWGMWGLLLGVPILMVVKTICERVDDLAPLAEFLGE